MRLKLVIAVLICFSLASGWVAAQNEANYDIIIRGGRVFDGAGNPWRYVDIAIKDGRIAAIGKLGDLRAGRIIDAKGLTVAPGFIDVHTHAGPGLGRELNHARPLIAQGITSVIVNPDGGGPIDIAGQRANYKRRGAGVNIAMFVPHGSIREHVLGMSDREPNGEELAQMKGLAVKGMEAGAIGMSTGLYYAPGSYSKTDEIIALADLVVGFLRISG